MSFYSLLSELFATFADVRLKFTVVNFTQVSLTGIKVELFEISVMRFYYREKELVLLEKVRQVSFSVHSQMTVLTGRRRIGKTKYEIESRLFSMDDMCSEVTDLVEIEIAIKKKKPLTCRGFFVFCDPAGTHH